MLTASATVQSDDPGSKPNGAKVQQSDVLRRQVEAEVSRILSFVDQVAGSSRYDPFERDVVRRVFRLGRLLVMLFLALASERLDVPTSLKRGRRVFRRQPDKLRQMGTFFGKVGYTRAYMHQLTGRGGGFFPLDLELGFTADGFSLGVLSHAVRLATKMSYSAAVGVMASFLRWAPSVKTVEHAVLGLGTHTAEWFEHSPPPDEDGEVLVIQIDSKATPTVRKSELKKRRGKRSKRARAPSPRHRGRTARYRRGPKKRRKKGDKAKNGRMTTVVVMYTLKGSEAEDGSPLLLGPINRRIYASYAPKRHAVAFARREADKRGFGPGTGKQVQVVTDGDEDLARYVAELLPHAIHTLDVIHVVERLWEVGACLFREGSVQLTEWVEDQKAQLYMGRIGDVLINIETEFQVMQAGRKRDKLDAHLNYLIKRTHMMNYGELASRDLELASGAVEGAVRFVVAQRFDEGGMRWIRQRAEALLQLRCIEINGDWDTFVDFAGGRIRDQQSRRLRPERILRKKPKPLPVYGLTL